MRDIFDPEYVRSLIPKITGKSDHNRLALLFSDWQAAKKALQEESTPTNRKNYNEAEAALRDIGGEIANRYDPEPDAEPTQAITRQFRNQADVLKYLNDEGWKIAKSQFYKHCKEGLLRPAKNGHYSQKAVYKYANTWLKLVATGQKVNDRLDRMQEEKLEHDLKAAKFKMEEAEFNLGIRKHKFVPREDFELAIVGRAVAFMAHLNHTVQTEVADWIDIVGGDQARAPELVQAISQAIGQRMGDFAIDAEFEVILEGN